MGAALLLGMVGLGLRLWPSRSVQRMLALTARVPRLRHAAPRSSQEIGWAVTAASRYVPWATCLTRALVAQVQLERGGHPARLSIGVARDGDGALRAHAWLEGRTGVVIGGSEASHYTPLSGLESGRPHA